jgi:uncharacterized protein YndB with AHSA1/START domain
MPASNVTPQEFALKIWINAQPRDLFTSWVRPDQLAQWFQHQARAFSRDAPTLDKPEAATGDHYEWRLNHGHRSTGRFLEVNPDAMLVRFTFGGDSGMTTEFRAEPRDGATLVTLVHRGLPSDDVETHADIKCGWTFYLTNLKAWHEHRVDLREHEPQRIRAGVLNI